MNRVITFLQLHAWAFVVIVFLAVMPFWWFEPGVIDIGGDSGRLYFYDPLTALNVPTLYGVLSDGMGRVEYNITNAPFFFLSYLVKSVVLTPHATIAIFNALKLIGGFLGVFLIVKTLIEKSDSRSEMAAIIAGVLYTFSPIIIGNFDRALLYHNQVFLNPILFYLILRFFLSHKFIYLLSALLISVVFSHNFSILSAPPFFAFYPVSILFITCYVLFVRKRAIPWRKTLFGFLLFVLLHFFHLFPTAMTIFDSNSHWSKEIFAHNNSGVFDHFYAILSGVRVAPNFFLLDTSGPLRIFAFFMPAIIVVAFLVNKKRPSAFLLSVAFLLIIFYLVTASITHTGAVIYSRFFLIPGYNMFRNFNGQWAFVFAFFYALVFGQGLYILFSRFPNKFRLVSILLVFIFFVFSIPYITGERVDKINLQTEGVKYGFRMDPSYEKTLEYIKNLPDDSKLFVLPFTDYSVHVFHGTNNGAYLGLSPFAFLLGKNDFPGYMSLQNLAPEFIEAVKNDETTKIKQLLGLLNVRYIYHNSDGRVYDTTFTGYPYSYMKPYFPDTQKEYKTFVASLADKEVYENNFYKLYTLSDSYFLPKIYSPHNVITYQDTATLSAAFTDLDVKPAYLTKSYCEAIFQPVQCKKDRFPMLNNPTISFKRINPVKYIVKVSNITGPFLLVLSQQFNSNWKLYPQASHYTTKMPESGTEGMHTNEFINQNTFETLSQRPHDEEKHVHVNGYANAWYVDTLDGKEDQKYFIIEMIGQRYIYSGLLVSLITLVITIVLVIVFAGRRRSNRD